MSKTFHIIDTLAMLLAAFFLCVSCSDMREDMSDGRPKFNYVHMKVTVPEDFSDKPDTRAVSATEEERVISTMRVFAFSKGRSVGYYYQDAPILQDFLMDIDMYGIDPETRMQTISFYIVVNEEAMVMEEDMPELGKGMTEKQLNDLRFIALNHTGTVPMFYADTVMVNTSATIPVSSLESDVDTQGHEEHQVLARKLSFILKRPFGKVTFAAAKLSSNTPDVYVNEVSLLARGTRHYNYLMPQSEQTLKSIDHRLNDRPLMEENRTAVITRLSTDGFETLSESYCFEVPYGSSGPQEWNVPNSDNSPVIKVVYSVGLGEALRTIFIYLPPINRNDWIQVNCTISGEGQIIVNYSVKDWDYEMTDDNGDGEEDYIVFDYPTHTYFLPAMPTAENPEPDPDGSVKVLPQMSVSKPFVCYFQMLYPEGQTWKPTIISSDVAASDFDISVYMNDSDEAVAVDGEGGYGLNTEKSSYYRIEVMPLNAGNVGASLRLGITSEIQGFGHSEYLLINGSQAELFWPSEGGSDPNALTITQIE